MSNILVLAPHPDDMEIGCGGSIAEYVKRGDNVHLFVATDGGRGGDVQVRQQEQQDAARILGIITVHWGHFEDTQLPACFEALMRKVELLVSEVRPATVFVNHHEDTHQDHRALARVAHSATRYVPNVMAYETPTSIGFEPTVFMDISSTMQQKEQALMAHASQVERTNIQGLSIIDIATSTAHFRGIQGRLNSAEAFVPLRIQI